MVEVVLVVAIVGLWVFFFFFFFFFSLLVDGGMRMWVWVVMRL